MLESVYVHCLAYRLVKRGLNVKPEVPVPVIFGILTVDNQDQARERIGGIHGHKGEEAADAALKMISFSRAL